MGSSDTQLDTDNAKEVEKQNKEIKDCQRDDLCMVAIVTCLSCFDPVVTCILNNSILPGKLYVQL